MILIFNLINDFACMMIPWDKVEDEFVREPRKWDAPNLTSVMVRYGPMCVVTDIMTWLFMIFVIFPTIAAPDAMVAEGYANMKDMVLGMVDLSSSEYMANGQLVDLVPFMVLFQSIWCIEQYWMQVWSIHIVRTNKLPFFQSWSCKALVATTIIALFVGTVLPFTGGLWEAISGCSDLIAIPLWCLIWMPFIACVYFFGSHLVKKRMLRTHGYFAC